MVTEENIQLFILISTEFLHSGCITNESRETLHGSWFTPVETVLTVSGSEEHLEQQQQQGG